jgi:uncharacterized protein with PQ loop repeat
MNFINFHHLQLRKRIYKNLEPFPHPEKAKRIVDHLIYACVFIGPVMNIPQLYEIWSSKDAEGVSLATWLSFLLFSAVWFVYGFLHKEKPVIIMNSILVVLQSIIVSGIIIYS